MSDLALPNTEVNDFFLAHPVQAIDRPEEHKILLTDVAKILLWSRRNSQ